MSTSPFAGLDRTDQEALSMSARDLSDIDQRTQERIATGFDRAYDTARRIAEGTLDPLTH
ncbi:hypothetical protein FZI85_14380 [Mycobacterium sp. CBMA293]|uniref:hypothetical protein n=1 Tax=unclassified Mycolicibacterium TaxID=2636767 RepID=UPI0012DFC0E9|nr:MULTISPECIES: hypothetical protein [unclassified Mycolicibacterium]MUL48210.1 hypothetical protein [Mycolicibacterium sp. CBMA 360]MUL57621.1 hypothetical protein [Mycolicibacterium sp. CBMA 335]MUL70661.1 hypothetical protein [Mycolicibacterium sp. CBMA 311]MUL92709.1 hypothetical protein [Mycolicibacterium sp. CBMA 230]MUM08276.1 hypothetical protein [Mycolicibacterium sp. CBMA 213]